MFNVLSGIEIFYDDFVSFVESSLRTVPAPNFREQDIIWFPNCMLHSALREKGNQEDKTSEEVSMTCTDEKTWRTIFHPNFVEMYHKSITTSGYTGLG